MKAYIVEIKLMVFTGRGRKLVDAKREPGLAFLRLGPPGFRSPEVSG